MGSTRKGMLNVLIAAVLWGSSGVCAQYIMEQSQMSSQFFDYDAFDIRRFDSADAIICSW
ncbi:transport protein YicL [Escherichia coli]|nr:transport protein YicL [Escherichia coli]